MRLTDLAPKWLLPPQWAELSPPFYVGVTFESPRGACPTCGRGGRRLALRFHPPIDPEGLAAQYGDEWMRPFLTGHARTGDTFDTLTLTPSVDFAGVWHGHITNGEITDV